MNLQMYATVGLLIFGMTAQAQPIHANKPVNALNDPASQAWMNTVAAMPAGKQLEAVAKRLRERNPGFEGMVAYEIQNGVVISFGQLNLAGDASATRAIENGTVTSLTLLHAKRVTDISPVQALRQLTALTCQCDGKSGEGGLSDLSPLHGMKLGTLDCKNSQVSDLSALKGMPLTSLDCSGTKVTDLAPLKGMQLTIIGCECTQVCDLTPLLDCQSLIYLAVRQTRVTPARVAALQKALPNCTIEWDDPAAAQPPPAAGPKNK